MKVCVYTLGCKVNQYESGAIMRMLIKKGYEVTSSLVVADAYIINTCAVTNEAERKSRQVVSKLKKLNANAKIIVCGCSSQNDSAKFEQKGRLIIGTGGKANLVEMLEKSGVLVSETSSFYEEMDFSEMERVRAYIKIQDGCNSFCSYCIVPYLRGRSRSRNEKSILEEIKVSAPYVKEFVITGINISDYGRDIGTSLQSLMPSLQSENYRIRLGSLEIGVITPAFLSVLEAMSNFCEHFHLSLQSGCSTVLKKMNRHYTSEEYAEKVHLIREVFPNAAITTDIIAGFPTETQEEHLQTMEFAKKIAFADIHVFPYSRREGTLASKQVQLDGQTIKQRSGQLIEIKQALKSQYISKNIGVLHEVLLEEKQDGVFVGYTKNYIRAYIDDNGELCENQLILAILIGEYGDGAKFQTQ